MPKENPVTLLNSPESPYYQSDFLKYSHFQKSKVLAFIGIWIATHIHILDLGKDAKIPLQCLDLWVLNPQSPHHKKNRASCSVFLMTAKVRESK